jgi:hypothetical protein
MLYKIDAWGVTQGSSDLVQHAESTTKEELKNVFAKATSGTAIVTNGKTV